MTVKEFNQMYGCDVIDIIRKQLNQRGGTGSSKRVGIGASSLSLKTPAVKFAGRPPMTRTVRKGERVL